MLGVYTKGIGSGIRALETTAGVGSLIGFVDPITRRVLVRGPFAPPVVEGGIPGVYCSGSLGLCDTPIS